VIHGELEIPAGPRGILSELLSVVLDFIPAERIVLGGGTALAARWQHRESLDVDLFVDPVIFDANIYHHAAECEDRLARLGFGRLATLDEHGCHISHRAGNVDIVGCFPLTPDSRSRDFVAGTGIALETNREILAKRLHRQILGHGQIVPRDLYDFAFARRFEPESMQAAWKAQRVVDADSLVAALGSFAPGWMDRQEETVLGARYPELEAHAVKGMLDDVLGRFPSLSPDRRRQH